VYCGRPLGGADIGHGLGDVQFAFQLSRNSDFHHGFQTFSNAGEARLSREKKCISRILGPHFLPNCLYRHSRPSQERGASLVEYAFILFIFLTLIFGIGGFGHALFVYHFLDHAAKEATRYAAVRGSSCGNDGSCASLNSASGTAGPATLSDVQQYVTSITPQSIDSTKITVTACGLGGASTACADSTPTVCTTAIGSGATAIPATPNYPGCTVEVQVSYAYNFIFPFLPSVSTTTAPCTSTGICMTSTSEMIIAH
jgi:Flp pilus assembly protein TadG